MAQRALAEGPAPDPAQFELAKAVGEHAGAAVRAGVAPDSADALPVIDRLEAMTPGEPADRTAAADRIEAFSDRRVARYWALVAIVNGWPESQAQSSSEMYDAWEWYGRALRAHA
jgi:hypothetical protein